jgi:hypothetical protein
MGLRERGIITAWRDERDRNKSPGFYLLHLHPTHQALSKSLQAFSTHGACSMPISTKFMLAELKRQRTREIKWSNTGKAMVAMQVGGRGLKGRGTEPVLVSGSSLKCPSRALPHHEA